MNGYKQVTVIFCPLDLFEQRCFIILTLSSRLHKMHLIFENTFDDVDPVVSRNSFTY